MTGEERICGAVMPDRLWLVDMGSGDISWSAERNPHGEEPLEAVDYVRLASTQPAPTLPSIDALAIAIDPRLAGSDLSPPYAESSRIGTALAAAERVQALLQDTGAEA